MDVVEFLNALFWQFDAISEKYDLEEIKTIGDAYMVAAVIPVSIPDHAEQILKMAIGMMNEVVSFPYKASRFI